MFSQERLWNTYKDVSMSNISYREIDDIIYFCSIDNDYGSQVIRKFIHEYPLDSILERFVDEVIFAENKSILLYLLDRGIITPDFKVNNLSLEDYCLYAGSINLFTYFNKARPTYPAHHFKTLLFTLYEYDMKMYESDSHAEYRTLPLDNRLFLLSSTIDPNVDCDDTRPFTYYDLVRRLINDVFGNMEHVAENNKLIFQEVFNHNVFDAYNTIKVVLLTGAGPYNIPILLDVLKSRSPLSIEDNTLVQALYDKGRTIDHKRGYITSEMISTALHDTYLGTILYLLYKSITIDFGRAFDRLFSDYPEVRTLPQFRILLTTALFVNNYGIAEILYSSVPNQCIIPTDILTLSYPLRSRTYGMEYFSLDDAYLTDYEYMLFMLNASTQMNKTGPLIDLYTRIILNSDIHYVIYLLFDEIRIFGEDDVLLLILLSRIGVISYNMTPEQKSTLLRKILDSRAKQFFEYILNTPNLPTESRYGHDIISAMQANRLGEVNALLESGHAIPYQEVRRIMMHSPRGKLFRMLIGSPQVEEYEKNLALEAIRTNNMDALYVILMQGKVLDNSCLYQEASKYNRSYAIQLLNEYSAPLPSSEQALILCRETQDRASNTQVRDTRDRGRGTQDQGRGTRDRDTRDQGRDTRGRGGNSQRHRTRGRGGTGLPSLQDVNLGDIRRINMGSL